MERRSKGLFNDMNEAFERLKKAQISSLDKKREEKKMVFLEKIQLECVLIEDAGRLEINS